YAIAEAFAAAGITAEGVDGTTPLDVRRATLARFEAGTTQVLTNCQVFTEGWDCPRVDCVIVARPTRSRAFYTQMVGRGTRTYPGKDDCLILDVVGASQRHELMTVASLFELNAAAVADGGVLEAEAARQAAVQAAQERRVSQRPEVGPLAAHVVDLFRQH